MATLRDWYDGILQTLVNGDPNARFCVVAIAGLAVAFYFQTFLLRPMKYDMKKLGRDVYASATRQYVKFCWIGWTLVFLGIAAWESVALGVSPFQEISQREIGLVVGAFFILWGIGMNFRSFVRLFIRALREKLN